MKCYLHKDRESETACTLCGHLICNECDVLLGQHHICKKCLAEAERVPAPLASPAPAVTNEPLAVPRKPSRFGHLAVPLLFGAIAGGVGGSLYRATAHGPETFFGGVCAGIGSALAAYFVSVVLAHMVIPAGVIREKKSVLGVFGVTDYAETLLYTVVFGVIFWIWAYNNFR